MTFRRTATGQVSISGTFGIVLLFLAQSWATYAATITVTTTEDELNADGDCSLREGIQAANTDTAVDACSAGNLADAIDLPAGIYTLSISGADNLNLAGDLDIAGDISINGGGADTTIIDGNGLDRVFHILPGNTVEIANVMIRNGNASNGGGILNAGTLTLNNSSINDNTAGNAGGISQGVDGTLTLNNSTVSRNAAIGNVSGGIHSTGMLTLNNSTVSGNSARNTGGGIGNGGSTQGTMILNNSTISDNTAGNTGASIRSAGSPGSVRIKNTILSSNGSGQECSVSVGTINSLGHNLSDDSSCGLTAIGDLENTFPLLGPLADNGGPTETHALLAGSPAIDAGSPDCPPPATDQRGFTRSVATCDIGAFELGTLEFTSRTPLGSVFWNDVIFANGMFVAVGGSNLDSPITAYSTDGINWQFGNVSSGGGGLPNYGILGVTYGGGTFVGVGWFGTVITSTDGMNWQLQDSGIRGDDRPMSVAYGNGAFVFSGAGFSAANRAMLVYRSVDNGVTWNKALSFPVQIWLNGIGFANNQFVIVGDLDAILTSPDGIGWTSRTSSVITSWHRDVAFGAGTFVAVARKRDTFDVGEITTSADGITWTKLPVPGFDDLRSVTFGAGQFVAVGRNGEAAVSTDGSAWTAVASDTTNELNGVAFGNNRFVIVGRFGTISTAVLAGQNEAPTANAGVDQAARVGDTVVLNGSGSFDDNTATASLEYAWSFVSFPAGSNATFTEVNTATPSFTIDASGTYEIELVVTDEGGLQSLPDVIVVSSDNVAPTAIAGADQLVIVGSIVTLDGSNSSDPEMDELRYLWSIDKRPLGSIADLVTSDVAVTTFAPDLIGAYEVSLTVSDFIGPGVPDSVLVTAVSAEDFAQVEILEAYDTLVSLPPTDVTTEGNQIALGNFFQQATVAIQEGDSAEAINKLQKAIARTDGCVLRGTPDGDGPERDWVTNCADQAILYGSLTSALEALQQ